MSRMRMSASVCKFLVAFAALNSFPRPAWECRPARSACHPGSPDGCDPRPNPGVDPATRSVEDGIPTLRVGTRRFFPIDFDPDPRDSA